MAHVVILVVLLLIAVVVVMVDVRRGKKKEQRLLGIPPQPPVEEIVVDQTRVAIVAHGNPVTRLTIRRLLEQQGYDVVEARDGDATGPGLAALTKTARPAVIIVDCDLPESGGVDLVRSIQADSTSEAVRIVILTAHADDVAAELDDGVVHVGYLRKPFSSEALIAALHSETG